MKGKDIVLNGIITDIFPSEIYGQFEKRVVWIKQPDSASQYPEHWAIEFWQGDGNIPDRFKRGDLVNCTIDIRGKAWTKNDRRGVIVSLKCWKMERQGPEQSGAVNSAPAAQQRQPTQAAGGGKWKGRQTTNANNLDEPLNDMP